LDPSTTAKCLNPIVLNKSNALVTVNFDETKKGDACMSIKH
jgi:hypothetical protein